MLRSWLALTGLLSAACGQPARSPADAPGSENIRASVERGRSLYQAHGCVVCHGRDGHGDGPAAASLNPRPRDFRDLQAYVQGTGVEDIARTLDSGVRSGKPQMPPYSHLPADDRYALATFIVSMRTQ